LFGHAAFAPGAVKATYGTGSSLMTLTDRPLRSHYGLAATVGWAEPGRVRYALEGNITNTGGAVRWFGDFLGLGGGEAAAALAATVADAGGVYLVPAFAGLGAPHWDADARGLICGLTGASTAAHVARATLDSIAYQVADVFEAMRKDSGMELPALLADGGASCNDSLMQFQADILDRPVIRSASPDLSARGAAWLAGLATGFWQSLEQLAALKSETTRFEPAISRGRRGELLDGWRDALSRTMTASAAPAQAIG
jgi:glycerol kinase